MAARGCFSGRVEFRHAPRHAAPTLPTRVGDALHHGYLPSRAPPRPGHWGAGQLVLSASPSVFTHSAPLRASVKLSGSAPARGYAPSPECTGKRGAIPYAPGHTILAHIGCFLGRVEFCHAPRRAAPTSLARIRNELCRGYPPFRSSWPAPLACGSAHLERQPGRRDAHSATARLRDAE